MTHAYRERAAREPSAPGRRGRRRSQAPRRRHGDRARAGRQGPAAAARRARSSSRPARLGQGQVRREEDPQVGRDRRLVGLVLALDRHLRHLPDRSTSPTRTRTSRRRPRPSTTPTASTCSARFAVQNRQSIPLSRDAAVDAERGRSRRRTGRSRPTRGLDPKGIVRAAWSNLRSDSGTQGASTITQQYVKILYLSQERT